MISTNQFNHDNLLSHSNKIYAFDSENECVPKPPTSPIPNRSLEELESAPIKRPIILSPLRTPISVSLTSNIKKNISGFTKSQKNGYNIMPTATSKLLKKEETIRLTNGETPPPPPSMVLPCIPILNSNQTDDKNKHQRYSHSFDSSSKFSNTEKNNRQNRTSAPSFAIDRSRLETVLLNPPPLPPLPIPLNGTLKNEFLFENELKLTNGEQSKKIQKNSSRIPILLHKGISRSQTPSPTVEIGTQTNGVVSALKLSFWSKSTQKNINKILNDHNSYHKNSLFFYIYANLFNFKIYRQKIEPTASTCWK